MRNLLIIIITLFSFTASAQTVEEVEMFDLVNQVRTNPKSFIPVIEEYILNIKRLMSYGVNFTNKTTGNTVDIIGEAKLLIIFLDTIKPINKLTKSSALYPIAKTHAEYLDSTNQLSHTNGNGESLDVRTKSSRLNCGENCVNNVMAKKGLVDLLIDLSSKDKGHRLNIFNPKYTQLAIGKSHNTWVQDFGY